MCVACRGYMPKSSLIRVTKTKDERFSLYPKEQGRGGYVCRQNECLSKCVNKKLFNKAFGMQVPQEIYDKLKEYYETGAED